jgi:S-formylglutathione hydrolase FrmB
VLGVATMLSTLALSGFVPVSAGPAGGQVLQGTFPGTLRPGLVYLPPGFSRVQRYPVVYLLHGMPGSPSEFPEGTSLVTFADEAIARGALRPFIAVMPAAGTRPRYNGEWAGQWEQGLVEQTVPWVDANLPTIASPRGRVIAGLSAGGFGAVDIAVRHPDVFGAAESWSGYFTPLRDGPFKQATATALAAHDPTLLARKERQLLRRDGLRFFVSSGPSHSHWFKESASVDFAGELQALGLPVKLQLYPTVKGEWSAQLAAGLTWAFGPGLSPPP